MLDAQAGTAVFPEFSVATARDYLQAVAQVVQTQAVAGAEVSFIQARMQSQLGREDEAERLARQALGKEPERADILSFLAQIAIRQERLAEALAWLRQAVQLDPKVPEGYQRLGMVLDRRGDRPGARAAFEAGLRERPEDGTLLLLLGRLLLDEGQPKEACVILEKGCQASPNAANAFFVLSQAQMRLGQAEAARETLKTFRTLRDKEMEHETAMTVAYDDEKALRKAALELHTSAATLLAREGQDNLAEAHLQQVLRVAPAEALGYERLASFYVRKQLLPLAREVYEEMAKRWPSNAAYRVNLGTLLLQLKKTAGTEELRRALALDPNQTEALRNLAAYLLGTRQETTEALALCVRLVAVQPTAANYDLLGWAYYTNGQGKEARAATAKAVEREPNNPTYREHLRRLEDAP